MKGIKELKNNEHIISELWDKFKWINMLTTGVHDGENRWEKNIWRNNGQFFSNLMKTMYLKIYNSIRKTTPQDTYNQITLKQ